MKIKNQPTTSDDRAFFNDMLETIGRHLKPDTKERLLALAAYTVGMMIAHQDQRIKEEVIRIVQVNIELGNGAVLDQLMGTKNDKAI